MLEKYDQFFSHNCSRNLHQQSLGFDDSIFGGQFSKQIYEYVQVLMKFIGWFVVFHGGLGASLIDV